MRKFVLTLAVIISGILISALAEIITEGNLSYVVPDNYTPPVKTLADIPANSYRFGVTFSDASDFLNGGHLYYSTATQQNISASRIWDSDTKANYFYVPAGEEPVSFFFTTTLNLGIKSATNTVTGNEYKTSPNVMQVTAAAVNPDELVLIELLPIDEVRYGSLTFNVDDPTHFHLFAKNGGVTTIYTARDFKDGKLVVKYAPESETDWYVSHDEGKNVFRTYLDGKELTRTKAYVYESYSKSVYRPVHIIKAGKAEHTIDVKMNFPEIQVPMTFKVVNDGGNETNSAKLDEKIEWISIDGTRLDRDAWEGGKTFYISNGSYLSFGLKPQTQQKFEVKSRTCNGFSFNTNTNLLVDTENEDIKMDIVIRALVNNDLRFQVNSEDYDKFEASLNHYSFDLTSPVNDITYRTYETDYTLDFAPLKGYLVDEVTLDGTTYTADKYGKVSVPAKGMDKVFEVKTKAFERNIPFNIYVDAGTSEMMFTLSDGQVNIMTTDDLPTGRHTLMVHPSDFPIYIHESSPTVFVDGVQQKPVGRRLYLDETAIGKDVRIYNGASYTFPVNFNELPSGVEATVVLDGKQVSVPGTFFVLPGSVFEITPTKGSNLMLQTGANSYIDPAADGKFTYAPKASADLTLRPKAIATINCASNWKSIELEYVKTGKKYTLDGASSVLPLPYEAGASASTMYEFKVADPSGSMRLETVAAGSGTTSSDFSYDVTTGVLKIKSGKAYTFTVKENPKPYYLNIHVAPENYYYNYDAKLGKYCDAGAREGYEYNSLLYIEPVDYYEGAYDEYEGMPKEMLGMVNYSPMSPLVFLRWGDNNYYRDYTVMDEAYSQPYNPNVEPNKAFNLNASQFPVKIHNPIVEQGQYVENEIYRTIYVVVDNEFVEIQPGEYYEIEKPKDGEYNIDVRVSLRQESPSEVAFGYVDGHNYRYQIDGGEIGCVNEQYPDPASMYSFSTIKIMPMEGETLKMVGIATNTYDVTSADLEEGSYTWTIVEPDEKGEYVCSVPNQDMYEHNSHIVVSVKAIAETTALNVQATDPSAGVTFSGVMLGSNSDVELPSLDNLIVTCYSGYRITSIVDNNTGVELPFNPSTGELLGVTPDMDLKVNVEKYDRDRTLTIQSYGGGVKPAFDNNRPTLVLAENTPNSSTGTFYYSGAGNTKLNTATVKFHPADVITMNNMTYGGGKYYAAVFLNNEAVPCVNGVYQFPTDIPDGSTILVLRPDVAAGNVAEVKVDYQIEDGLNVVAMTGDDAVATGGLPVTSTIKVVPDPDNVFEYKAEYSIDGGETWQELPAEGYTIKTTDKQLAVRVEKTYNTITLDIAEGTDLDNIKIVADGVTYTIDPETKTVKIPTHVKSISVLTTEEDSYLTIEGGNGMDFDVDHGSLTDLSSGTITVATKHVDRESEVKVFLDDDTFSAGALVLGSGKTIQTDVNLTEGFQTIKFAEEDLPLIYRVNTYVPEGEDENGAQEVNPDKPETMPAVFVNGKQLEYSPEHQGYIFPVDALTGDETPVIKIYAPNPETAATDPSGDTDDIHGVTRINLFYLVEKGITFRAVEDFSTTVTEGGLRRVLPSTMIELMAESESGDDIFVEINGEKLVAQDGKFTIMTGNDDLTIAVKLEKIAVTVKAAEWQGVKVTGNGFTYDTYDETSTFEFPQSTRSITLHYAVDGMRITEVKGNDDTQVNFDPSTGIVTGVTDGMTLNLVMEAFTRDRQIMVYLEEADEPYTAAVVLSKGKALEKTLHINEGGYHIINVHNDDLPLGVETSLGTEAVVYINNELAVCLDGVYSFPANLPDNTIVKIYSAEQDKISLYYNLDLEGYDFNVWHDHMTEKAVDTEANHQLLPGTDIRFTITPATSPARFSAPARDAVENLPVVKVNDEALTPDENGVYSVKVQPEHATTGLIISAEGKNDHSTTSIGEVNVSAATVDVYDLKGTLILRNAASTEVNHLPAGIYIINGAKRIVR